ncbi:hypothetical protein C8T65DRAFT_748483 [Cerioporus squamosus]|nr:hypothetical protein C8T65DRAFT_748483 [Cerioporus squamosus]
MTTTRIYARWADQLELSIPTDPLPVPAHAYDAPIPPPICPSLGERVQIIALSPMVYRTMFTPLGGTRKYDVYDPQVEGVVEGVCMAGKSRVAFTVKNFRRESGVQWVVVTVPFVEGVMRQPEASDCPADWLRRCLAEEQSDVELQCDAVVEDELGDVPTSPVTLQYADPRVWQRDRLLTECFDRWRPANLDADMPVNM